MQCEEPVDPVQNIINYWYENNEPIDTRDGFENNPSWPIKFNKYTNNTCQNYLKYTKVRFNVAVLR